MRVANDDDEIQLRRRDSQIRMTNDKIRRNDQIRMTKPATAQVRATGNSGFGFLSSLVIQRLMPAGSESQCALKKALRFSMNPGTVTPIFESAPASPASAAASRSRPADPWHVLAPVSQESARSLPDEPGNQAVSLSSVFRPRRQCNPADSRRHAAILSSAWERRASFLGGFR